ncbi:putative protein DENND6A [Paratrimastix pyriformis]|uniref:Uncharacterized protein n=1 Tax=Paratrimastix pyriformis TaxID=342808 RepID=A0ABQ8UWI0_9EUKA|nr:putative protein DENND6A [Paratrimastix pyriformis]
MTLCFSPRPAAPAPLQPQQTSPKAPPAAARPPPAVIVGATNPYFHKMLKHWPYILFVGKWDPPKGSRPLSSGLPAYAHKEELSTAQKPLLAKSKALAKAIAEATSAALRAQGSTASASAKEAAAAASGAIRRYFAEQTRAFLAPFEAYFRAHLPPAPPGALPTPRNPFGTPPQLPLFPREAFLKAIREKVPPGLPASSRPAAVAELYRRFLDSPNWAGYLALRTEARRVELAALYEQAAFDCRVDLLVKSMDELSRVDLFIGIGQCVVRAPASSPGIPPASPPPLRHRLILAAPHPPCPRQENECEHRQQFDDPYRPELPAYLREARLGRLRAHLRTVMDSLPPDLQQSITTGNRWRDEGGLPHPPTPGNSPLLSHHSPGSMRFLGTSPSPLMGDLAGSLDGISPAHRRTHSRLREMEVATGDLGSSIISTPIRRTASPLASPDAASFRFARSMPTIPPLAFVPPSPQPQQRPNPTGQ